MTRSVAFARYKSKQDYATPREFLEVVQLMFGTFDVDLAATPSNRACANFVGPPGNHPMHENELHRDALAPLADWDDLYASGYKTAWLNPPFADVKPWVMRCAMAEKLRILLLVPAAVGSNWWVDYVHRGADRVFFVRPRLSFDGKNPYPKDVALVEYNVRPEDVHPAAGPRPFYECWSWR